MIELWMDCNLRTTATTLIIMASSDANAYSTWVQTWKFNHRKTCSSDVEFRDLTPLSYLWNRAFRFLWYSSSYVWHCHYFYRYKVPRSIRLLNSRSQPSNHEGFVDGMSSRLKSREVSRLSHSESRWPGEQYLDFGALSLVDITGFTQPCTGIKR